MRLRVYGLHGYTVAGPGRIGDAVRAVRKGVDGEALFLR